MKIEKKIAETFCELAKGLSLAVISQATGLHMSHISCVRHGLRGVSIDNLKSLADFLGKEVVIRLKEGDIKIN
jgi:transcriptional regulator with XRE-family HTH domain